MSGAGEDWGTQAAHHCDRRRWRRRWQPWRLHLTPQPLGRLFWVGVSSISALKRHTLDESGRPHAEGEGTNQEELLGLCLGPSSRLRACHQGCHLFGLRLRHDLGHAELVGCRNGFLSPVRLLWIASSRDMGPSGRVSSVSYHTSSKFYRNNRRYQEKQRESQVASHPSLVTAPLTRPFLCSCR